MSENHRIIRTDEELMISVRATDDAEAFALLVKRHQQNLLNYFTRSGVLSEAEDLVQQTFVRIYRYRDRYEARAKFTTFLFLLARQVRIDELRRRKRKATDRTGPLEDLPEMPEPREVSDTVHADNRADLRRALDSLSDGLRQVVVLGMFEDRPYAEIAEILGIPEGTVKSRMFNALAKLREFLTGDGVPPPEGKRKA